MLKKLLASRCTLYTALGNVETFLKDLYGISDSRYRNSGARTGMRALRDSRENFHEARKGLI